jgi:superfamily II DNA or RNA helicase
MPEAITTYLKSLVSTPVWHTGEKLFETGAVLDLRGDSRIVEARVASERGRFERTRLNFRPNGFSSNCSCREPHPICTHALATLLQLAMDFPEYFSFVPQVNLASKRPAVSAPAPRSTVAEAAETAPLPQSDSNSLPHHRCIHQLLPPTEQLARLILFLPEGPQSLENRWGHFRLEASLSYGDRTYAIGNIRKLMDALPAAGGMKQADFSLQDQQVMRFLISHSEIAEASFRLPASAAADLLHCLIDFEHLTWKGGQIRIHSTPAHPALLYSNQGQQIEIKPCLEQPQHGILPVKDISPVAGRSGVWAGIKGQYWWVPGLVDPAWLRFFLKGEPELMSEADFLRLRQACHQGRNRISLRAETQGEELAICTIPGIPVLTLDWRQRHPQGVLQIDYNGQRLLPGHDPNAPTSGPLIQRDPAGEANAIAHLQSLGFVQQTDRPHEFTLPGTRKLWTFLKKFPGCFSEHWQVFSSADFERKRAASSDLRLQARAHSEEQSWFELTLDMLTEAGTPLEWSKIQPALTHNQDFMTLDDGSVVHIPEEVKKVIAFLSRQAASSEQNLFHFDIYSALAVENALGTSLPSHSGNWQKLRDRLTTRPQSAEIATPQNIRAELRDYQKEGMAWVTMLEETGFHGILADEMGLGKTLQALCVIAKRRGANPDLPPSLVICPTSLLENWLQEAARFVPDLKTLAIRGTQRTELISQLPEIDLAITSYAMLRRDIEHYSEQPLDYVILDEAQHIKNPQTANARTCKSIQSSHRLVLTGTPLENSIHEVWSLFDFLLPGMLGSQRDFRQTYAPAPAETVPDPQQGALQLGTVIKPFILRRTKSEVCSQLPPKIEQVVYCNLSPGQQQLHQDMLMAGRELLTTARESGWKSHRFEVLSLLMRLRQLCCHPDLLPEKLRSVSNRHIPSAKTELMKEIILEAIDGGHRILLFSQFTSLLQLVRPWLEEEKISYEYMDGKTSDRQARVDRFNQDDSIPVFLLSLKAGGTGLNLTGADTVIIYDPWWNPMVEDQAMDRTHRIGQEKTVTVYKLVTRHSIEEKVQRLQKNKREIFDQVFSGAQSKIGDLKPSDFDFIFQNEL